MKNIKLFVSYTFLIMTLVLYVIISSYTYELELTKTNMEETIEELKESNDELTLEINMKNSRDSVLKDYPTLNFNNNIYHLDSEGDK